jgi:catechol 2,3-dioxygenase-like lactoylglutathione lyase family enzyme
VSVHLREHPVAATIPVSDMARAREFYEGRLGLSGGKDQADGGHTYPSGDGSFIHVYPSAGNAGKSGATLAAWMVDDVEGAVDQLIASGVTFEQYGEPLNTDEKGIARLDGSEIAWFRDPDGNILAVESR